jgi:hypothetical protein
MLNKEQVLNMGNDWLGYEVEHDWDNPEDLQSYLDDLEHDVTLFKDGEDAYIEISQAISILKERLQELENMEEKEWIVEQYELHVNKYKVKARTKDEAISLYMEGQSDMVDDSQEYIENATVDGTENGIRNCYENN